MKISIIGAGRVGTTTAYTLLMKGLARELVLVDIDKDRAKGEVLDMYHGLSLLPAVSIIAGDYEETANSDIIIITAGIPRKPGESRLELAKKNLGVMSEILANIHKQEGDPILLMVSNPVDVMTHLASIQTKVDKGKVLGLGCVLDTVRFRALLAGFLQVPPGQIKALMLGEHGDSMVPMLSMANVEGIALENLPNWNIDKYAAAVERSKKGGAEVIGLKGGTFYAVALSIAQVVEAIVNDTSAVLPVTSRVNNYLGLGDVSLSLPTVVGKQGVVRYLDFNPAKEEMRSLEISAGIIRDSINSLGLDDA